MKNQWSYSPVEFTQMNHTANGQSDNNTLEISNVEVTGAGKLQIVNTGGSSAAEGGMGSSNEDDRGKDDNATTSGGTTSGKDAGNPESFDPIKKNVKEKENNDQ